MTNKPKTVRLKVSPEVARVVSKEAPRELKLKAAGGELPFSEKDRVTSLFFLAHGGDPGIREKAVVTVKKLSAAQLLPVVEEPDLHPQLIDFIAVMRLEDAAVMGPLLAHPAVLPATLRTVAARGSEAVVSLLTRDEDKLRDCPELVQALVENPRAGEALKSRWGKLLQPPSASSPAEESSASGEGAPEEEDLNLSKYQQSLEMGVSDKIKMAMTGDKEWRNILIKEANKLVSSAVLKNPRITEGEVLTVAANRSTSEELIRLITLNNDWLKNTQIKKALIQHPRTPLPKALRYLDILTEKELKILAKSRNVSRVIVNSARRILIAKEKKR
jgi:hypothetical protein